MKRILICAAAAIVALASCSKTQVVYNDAPEEIGFKAVTGAMTKAEEFTDTYSLGVFAHINGSDPYGTYFENAPFTKNGEVWSGSKYWPINGALDFTVYAPHVTSANFSSNTLTITVPDNSTNQYDYLYGESRYLGKTNTGAIKTNLKHGLSKVTVKVYAGAADKFTLTDLILVNTVQNGNIKVTYNADGTFNSIDTDNPGSATNNIDFVSSDILVNATTSLSAQDVTSKYVFPSAQTSFAVTYNLEDSEGLEATVDLSDGTPTWEPGKHYIYTIKFSANEITFEKPSVLDWDENVSSEETIQ